MDNPDVMNKNNISFQNMLNLYIPRAKNSQTSMLSGKKSRMKLTGLQGVTKASLTYPSTSGFSHLKVCY